MTRPGPARALAPEQEVVQRGHSHPGPQPRRNERPHLGSHPDDDNRHPIPQRTDDTELPGRELRFLPTHVDHQIDRRQSVQRAPSAGLQSQAETGVAWQAITSCPAARNAACTDADSPNVASGAAATAGAIIADIQAATGH